VLAEEQPELIVVRPCNLQRLITAPELQPLHHFAWNIGVGVIMLLLLGLCRNVRNDADRVPDTPVKESTMRVLAWLHGVNVLLVRVLFRHFCEEQA
jgi:hypothetical protein